MRGTRQTNQRRHDSACAMEGQEEVISVPKQRVGLVIGRKGRRLEEIRSKTGVKIRVEDDGVHLRGTSEQREQAKKMIEGILARTQETGSSHRGGLKKLDFIPNQFIGHVIGKGRSNLHSIETETGVVLRLLNEDGKGSIYIRGSPRSERKAIRAIKTIINRELKRSRSGHTPVRTVFVDTAQLQEHHELQLCTVNPSDAHLWQGRAHKLILLEHPLQEETYAGFQNVDRLSGEILKVLRKIHSEKDEKGLKVDMWGHFGHVYLRKVDEDEEGEVYQLKDIKERLETTETDSWVPAFVEGVKEMEVKQIESYLSSRATMDDVRHDFTFYTPTCRDVRIKAWLIHQKADGEEGAAHCVFSRSAPVSVKNVLARVLSNEQEDTSETPNFHMCAQFETRMRVDILMPSKGFDCRLVLRTTAQSVPEAQNEEEDKILEGYLMGMKIDGDQLVLPPSSELPNGFDLFYQRRSLRRTYQYETEGEQFSLTVCKDQAKSVDMDDGGTTSTTFMEPKPDVHLHCEDWDRLLDNGDWEPEQIVAKLPLFLHFLRQVQRNVAP